MIEITLEDYLEYEKPQPHNNNFHLIAHEHLFVFRKPGRDEKISKFRKSTKW